MADSPPFPANGVNSTLNDTLNRQTMPNEERVLAEFETVLKRMDLAADKIRALRDCSLDKKWSMVCDQKLVSQAIDPAVYLDNLKMYIERKVQKKKYKVVGQYTPTQLLKHIEISLRTNSIDWARKFLDENHNGLRYIVTYMFLNRDCLCPVPSYLQNMVSDETLDTTVDSCSSGSPKLTRKVSFSKSASKSQKYINPKEEDDVHTCVLALRAIMNNKYGFNKVFTDNAAIYNLMRCILHPSVKTKALVVQALSAICFVNDGHELVMNAFSRFQHEYNERHRFSTLMHFFRDQSEFHYEFIMSCMQLINVLVNSVENYNYRVSLQHEFSLLGLEDYLKKLAEDECDSINSHLYHYLENAIDVGELIELPDALENANVKIEELQGCLSRSRERNQQAQAEYLSYKAKLQAKITELTAQQVDLVNIRDKEIKNKDAELEKTKHDLENLQLRLREITGLKESMESELRAVQSKTEDNVKRNSTSAPPKAPKPPERKIPSISESAPPPPPMPPVAPRKESGGVAQTSSGGPPPPPPPGPPPMLGKGMPPPPPPLSGLLKPAEVDCRTLRKVLQPKNKMPHLTWSALNPNQVKGTIFMDLNDEKLHSKVDFTFLEENFKLIDNSVPVDSGQHSPAPSTGSSNTKEGTTTLLSSKRLQNFAITKRKLARSPNDITIAVHRLDLQLLPAELVDLMLPMVPNDEEIAVFNDYAQRNDHNFDALSPEDKFVAALINIERLPFKLKIMSFMAGFDESLRLLKPSLMNLTGASVALKDSKLFPKVLEVILTFGNYLNGQKRGAAYGFRLSSLESLRVMKSANDHKLTLMHVICNEINEHFPDLAHFSEELTCLEAAAHVNLESIQSDVRQLGSTFKMVVQEHEKKENDSPEALKKFVETATPLMAELKSDLKFAAESFSSCVEVFGESSRTQQPSLFFSYINNFVKAYNQCAAELKERKAMSERKIAMEQRPKHQQNGIKERNGAVVSELNAKLNRRNEMNGFANKVKPSDIADGDFERLMNNLKDGYLASETPAARSRKLSPIRQKLESHLVNRERV